MIGTCAPCGRTAEPVFEVEREVGGSFAGLVCSDCIGLIRDLSSDIVDTDREQLGRHKADAAAEHRRRCPSCARAWGLV